MNKIIITAIFSIGTGLFLQAAPVLKAPPAPFLRSAKVKAPVSATVIKPVFDASVRRFQSGSKSLVVDENGACRIYSGNQCIGTITFYVSTDFASSMSNAGIHPPAKGSEKDGFWIKDLKVTANSVILSGGVLFNKKGAAREAGAWKETLTLLKDGKVDLLLEYTVPAGKKIGSQGVIFNFPSATAFTLGKNKRCVKFASPDTGGGFCNPAVSLQFDNPEDAISLGFPSNTLLYHFPKQNKFSLFPHPTNRTDTHIILDPMQNQKPAEAKVPGGVDFWALDRLAMPTRGEKNLLQNPYFAQGGAYMHPIFLYVDNNIFYPNRCGISEDCAKFGKYSLQVTGPHQLLQTSCIPADPGKYTFSFYAKGQGDLSAMFIKSIWYHHDPRIIARFYINSKDWKRYSFTYKHNSMDGFSVWLSAGRKDCNYYIDGLQVEKGTAATDFSAPAITGYLKGGQELFFTPEKKCQAEFEFSTLEKEYTGTVYFSLQNFFGEKVWQKSCPVQLKKNEYPSCTLDFGVLPQGIYVLNAEYVRNGTKQKLQDHFRFSVMPPLRDDYPTRRLFGSHYVTSGSMEEMTEELRPGAEAYYNRLRDIGIGSIGQPPFRIPRWIGELQENNHLLKIGYIATTMLNAQELKRRYPQFADKVKEGEVYWTVSPSKKYPVMIDTKLTGGWTVKAREEFKKRIAAHVAEGARFTAYGLGSEWPPSIKERPEYTDMVMAFTEAVRSVQPYAIVYQAGEMNMDRTDGVLKIDNFFTRMKKDYPKWKIQMMETHPFTYQMEELYPNFKAFMDVVNKHSKTCALAFTEGGQVNPYVVPAWNGIPSISWGRVWSGGTLSYALGWQEMISAALYARYYLVFLTEYGRVWNACAGAINSHNFSLDYELTPRAFQKVPNTLGQLFRNPKKYLGDYSFAPDVKCFVWLDGEDRPLAAVWNEDRPLSRGAVPVPWAVIPYSNAEYIDLMGVSRKPEVDGRFPVSSFPLFIRGKKGDQAAFLNALENTRFQTSGKLPFRISSSLLNERTLRLVLTNELRRKIRGSLTVQKQRKKIDLPPLVSQTIDIPLTAKLDAGKVSALKVPAIIMVDGTKFMHTIQTQVIIAKRFTGKWSDHPVITMTNYCPYKLKFAEKIMYPGDFKSAFQVAWDEKNFYLRILVEDDILSAGTQKTDRYDYDVAQVYMDTRCSARLNGKKGYDEDDYAYSIMPLPNGKECEIWRALSPDIQLTLGTKAPKNAVIATELPHKFIRTKTGYIYEVTFPADYMRPVTLKQGWNMGFGLYIADKDNGPGVKQAFSLATEKGQACYNKPQFWPLLYLGE